ncbi:MAG: flavin reductase family protein [Microbacteriaceae bacterium]|nr:flavin reductase family protein [Microbacteriaceae bacterium]MCL2793821.1 flavin reductase family protein [Microbacteriaceae bacterium]
MTNLTAARPLPLQLTADAFRSVFRGHPAGVAVIGALAGDRPVGFTATSVISVSAEPPLLAFSLPETSSSWPAVRDAETLTVSFLGADQHAVAARFATHGIDRFAAGGWRALPSGEPVVEGARSWIRGAVAQRTPAFGSRIVTLRAIDSSAVDEEHPLGAPSPLVYHDRVYHRIGAHSAIA